MKNIHIYKCKALTISLRGISIEDVYVEKEQSYGSITILENGYPKYDLVFFNPDGTFNEISIYMKRQKMDSIALAKDLVKRLDEGKYEVIGEPDCSRIVLQYGTLIDTEVTVEEFPIELFEKLYCNNK